MTPGFVNSSNRIGEKNGGGAKGVDRRRISIGESPDLPLLLYYGAGRLWDVQRNIETEKPGSQLDAHRFCLDPKSDQKAFEKWFKRISYSELQKKRPIPAVKAVKKAVVSCMPGADDFFYSTDDDQLMVRLENNELTPFNCLSDGYRNMAAMAADIAHRASLLNPQYGVDTAKKTNGVALIDEIDLHLHPRWQRRIIGDLRSAFPRLQFIATTHSPFILQSLAPGEVIDLNQTMDIQQVENAPEGVAAPGPGNVFSNRSIEDIIEEVMGVEVPQRSRRYQEMHETAREYYRVLKEAGSADQSEKEALKRKLDELSAPFSDNIAYHAFLEMERLDAGLGRSNKQEVEQ